MADELVTLATYPDPVQANEAVRRLGEADVQAMLVDDSSWGLGGLTGQGIGWIQLRVREADLDRAVAALRDPEEPAGDDEFPPDDADAEEPESEPAVAEQKSAESSPETPPDRGDRSVTIGLRLAILGFLFLPLTVAALVVLLRVAARDDRLTPESNRRYYLALFLALGWLAVLAFIFCAGAGAL